MELKISLKAARVNAEMTLAEASKAIGVSIQTLYNWETGKTSPNMEKARKISEAYNFPLDCIFLP